MRLDLRGWGIICAALLVITWALPTLGSAIEKFNPQADYRMPYLLSDDYWIFRQCAEQASRRSPVVIIGDSFVWGQYVGMGETLSHQLNRLAGEELVFNLGVNGLHPAAMLGMLQHYGGGIRDKGVILHLNFLWMSSPERDLQGEEELQFNHPRLLPQFTSQLACYRPDFAERLSIVLERNWRFLSWTRHIKQLYFENMDIPNWTLLNPYQSPLRAVTLRLPPPDEGPRSRPVPWTEQKIGIESFSWVSLEESYQWRAFQNAVEHLRHRGNSLLVVIGPFNPFLQTGESRSRYQNLRRSAEAWLTQQNITHYSPPVLPSELYADASHPLREGYVKIAEALFEEGSFPYWVEKLRVH